MDAINETQESAAQGQLYLPTYSATFLEHHAGRIIADPAIAIIELIANSWDAGASRVDVSWPSNNPGEISFSDNGTGITWSEFQNRWLELNYNRIDRQGPLVQFPSGNSRKRRTAFGRNGIGRHAMFFFAEQYFVTSTSQGQHFRASVTRSAGKSPFEIHLIEHSSIDGHGTRISANTSKIPFGESHVRKLIGSKFAADPDFHLFLNEEEVTLTDLESISDRFDVVVDDLLITVRRIDSSTMSRTSKQHGIAWWVQGRLVGEVTWNGLDGPVLDSRTSTAKRYTYIVEANHLKPQNVKKDWTGFHSDEVVVKTRRAVEQAVSQDLSLLLHDTRRERKNAVLRDNRDAIARLPPISRKHVVSFIDEIQLECPTLSSRDLSHAAMVLAKLEKARTGYALVEQLSRLEPDELDRVQEILSKWSVDDAYRVLSELKYRLDLVRQLTRLVRDKQADELHDLQPVFERGLWIFGPRFESNSFVANRHLTTVLRSLFKIEGEPDSHRPDIVMLPDSSIGVHSSDAFDSQHSVSGYDTVVVIELKRAGVEITIDEVNQANRYTNYLRKHVGSAKIIAFVLGTTIDPTVEPQLQGDRVQIIPRLYEAVLGEADARTFRLLRKLEESGIDGPEFDEADLFSEVDPHDQV